MDALIDSLDPEKWKTIEPSAKGDGYKEFRVMRQFKEDPKGVMKIYLLDDKDDLKTVMMHGCKSGQHPLKDVGTCEFKIVKESDEVELVEGIDVEGDIVVKK